VRVSRAKYERVNRRLQTKYQSPRLRGRIYNIIDRLIIKRLPRLTVPGRACLINKLTFHKLIRATPNSQSSPGCLNFINNPDGPSNLSVCCSLFFTFYIKIGIDGERVDGGEKGRKETEYPQSLCNRIRIFLIKDVWVISQNIIKI
jgi:hypothetical protein